MTVPTFTMRSRYVLGVCGRFLLGKSKVRLRILNPLRLPFRHSGHPFNYNGLDEERKARKTRFRQRFRQSCFVPVLFQTQSPSLASAKRKAFPRHEIGFTPRIALAT